MNLRGNFQHLILPNIISLNLGDFLFYWNRIIFKINSVKANRNFAWLRFFSY